jgi:nitronate monooxygenase
MWPDTRLLDLFGIELPIVQAPMAPRRQASRWQSRWRRPEGSARSLAPCSPPTKSAPGVTEIRSHTDRPINLNFFCPVAPDSDVAREQA